MHPIAPRPTVLAALILIGYLRALLRLALPDPPLAAHSGASNCCFQVQYSLRITIVSLQGKIKILIARNLFENAAIIFKQYQATQIVQQQRRCHVRRAPAFATR